MQVSAGAANAEHGNTPRARPSASKLPTLDGFSDRAADRGSPQRGKLARGSRQTVNERLTERLPDKQVFVARSLSSTLALLQMTSSADRDPHVPGAEQVSETSAADGSSFLEALLSGVLSSN